MPCELYVRSKAKYHFHNPDPEVNGVFCLNEIAHPQENVTALGKPKKQTPNGRRTSDNVNITKGRQIYQMKMQWKNDPV